MPYGNINCKWNDQGCWCKNKCVPRFLGFLARMCKVHEGKKCSYQEEYEKPNFAPPPCPSMTKKIQLDIRIKNEK